MTDNVRQAFRIPMLAPQRQDAAHTDRIPDANPAGIRFPLTRAATELSQPADGPTIRSGRYLQFDQHARRLGESSARQPSGTPTCRT